MVAVKAELVGPDVRASLTDVITEPLAQRAVEQMGGSVVALGCVARRRVDLGENFGPNLEAVGYGFDDERLIIAGADHADDIG